VEWKFGAHSGPNFGIMEGWAAGLALDPAGFRGAEPAPEALRTGSASPRPGLGIGTAPQAPRGAGEPMKDIRILLVEDDRENCLMLKEVLGKWGYQVTEAYSGEEALDRSRKEAFDIVLTDIRMAKTSGLDGVVVSGDDVEDVRAVCGDAFCLVVPGIRPAGGNGHDQVRVLTPAAAIEHGADYIVVGRPITAADDPVGVARAILREAR